MTISAYLLQSFQNYQIRSLRRQGPYARRMRFLPERTFGADQTVNIYLTSISTPFFSNPDYEFNLEFYTEPLPQPIAITPAPNTLNVLPDQSLNFLLDHDSGDQVEWSYTVEPSSELELSFKSDSELEVTAVDGWQQGTEYQFELFQQSRDFRLDSNETISVGEPISVYKLPFTTVKAPHVNNFQPVGDQVYPDSNIVFEFDAAMEKDDAQQRLTIEPEVVAEFVWNEEQTILTIDPVEELVRDQTYDITISAGAKNTMGGQTEIDINYQFKTLGRVQLAGASPNNGATGIWPNSRISVTFDQPVDQGSAQSLFRLEPATQGSFSWEGNTMHYQPSGMGHNVNYTVVVDAGVGSLYGLPSDQPLSFSFRTAPNRFMLNVPMYRQQEAWTCNFASARMLLAHRGTNVAESSLKSAAGRAGSKGSGNPYNGYVEDYGTYWPAVSRATQNYRSTTVYTNWNLGALLQKVTEGHPVMIWGQNGWTSPRNIAWTASDGTYIPAVLGMHSVVVVGYVGPQSNPSHVIINDPWIGQRTITASKFLSNWSYFNVAMVVW